MVILKKYKLRTFCTILGSKLVTITNLLIVNSITIISYINFILLKIRTDMYILII